MRWMKDIPTALYRADQVREMDRRAIEDHGTPGFALMSRAGEAALKALGQRWPQATRLLVLCGAGNNAGDAYVLARLAAATDYDVTVVALVDPGKLKGDAATAFEGYLKAGGQVTAWDEALIARSDVVVDGILGTGLDRPLSRVLRDVVLSVNRAHVPIMALDIPTGLHADSGLALGCAVRAMLTVTFIGLKAGLYVGEGPAHSGQVIFDDLGVPADLDAGLTPLARRLDPLLIGEVLPPRMRTAHKGHFGHLLVVGGGEGMAGAVRLAGEAALRAGAGLVTVGTRPQHVASIVSGRPELMCKGLENTEDLKKLMGTATFMAVGPGIGQTPWAHDMLEAALAGELGMVVDADALNLIAKSPRRRSNWILTPHPGEAARLLNCTTADIQNARLDAAQKLAADYGGVVVLKGAGTIVATEGEIPAVCDLGNPGMSTAGMGDVLTGVIAAIAAQGASLWDAARAGVVVHAAAGDEAAQLGERGLVAGDLIGRLRSWVNP